MYVSLSVLFFSNKCQLNYDVYVSLLKMYFVRTDIIQQDIRYCFGVSFKSEAISYMTI